MSKRTPQAEGVPQLRTAQIRDGGARGAGRACGREEAAVGNRISSCRVCTCKAGAKTAAISGAAKAGTKAKAHSPPASDLVGTSLPSAVSWTALMLHMT